MGDGEEEEVGPRQTQRTGRLLVFQVEPETGKA